MPKAVVTNSSAAVRVTDRVVDGVRTGRGGPFTKHQQQAVEKLRDDVREAVYEKPRIVR
jgi:hypothetical protein